MPWGWTGARSRSSTRRNIYGSTSNAPPPNVPPKTASNRWTTTPPISRSQTPMPEDRVLTWQEWKLAVFDVWRDRVVDLRLEIRKAADDYLHPAGYVTVRGWLAELEDAVT